MSSALPRPPTTRLYLVFENGCVDVYVGPERSARDYAANVEKVNRAVTKALSRRRLLAPAPALLARARQRRSSRPAARTARWVSGKKRKRHRSSSDGDDPDLASAHSESAQARVAPVVLRGVLEVRIVAASTFLPSFHDRSRLTASTAYDFMVAQHALAAAAFGGTDCLLCDRSFDAGQLPERFVIVRPDIDALRAKPDLATVINGVCADCSARPELLTRVLAYCRAHILGAELRGFDLAQGGRA